MKKFTHSRCKKYFKDNILFVKRITKFNDSYFKIKVYTPNFNHKNVSFQQFKNKILISNSIFNNTNSVNLSSTNLVNIINTNHELNELNITLISSLSKIQFHILIQKNSIGVLQYYFLKTIIPMFSDRQEMVPMMLEIHNGSKYAKAVEGRDLYLRYHVSSQFSVGNVNIFHQETLITKIKGIMIMKFRFFFINPIMNKNEDINKNDDNIPQNENLFQNYVYKDLLIKSLFNYKDFKLYTLNFEDWFIELKRHLIVQDYDEYIEK
ncbi:hypothetical protein H8356DRAFT_1369605 [Neocallimastix lanati (nom. inval.)]|nr:hypothetical protein H8356DRAFT_1369605 [Neocallimastix sp. JGI-2020a]